MRVYEVTLVAPNMPEPTECKYVVMANTSEGAAKTGLNCVRGSQALGNYRGAVFTVDDVREIDRDRRTAMKLRRGNNAG